MAKSKVTLKFNTKGFQEIRTSPGTMKMLNSLATSTANRAGDGFEAKPADVTGGRVRGRAAVVAVTTEAMRSEARDHALLKAIGSN